MSNSPVNFLGLGLAAAGVIGGRKSKRSRGKIKKRVSKLENQIEAIQRKENGTSTAVEETTAITPGMEMETQADTAQDQVGSMAEGVLGENSLQAPSASTIASPFSPSTQQAAGGMFGAQVPGSFDRDMGEEEDTY
tara:strand:- start:2917 stop:3324 length:408 start_codon:yes stop_codon:yes gene_type:complete